MSKGESLPDTIRTLECYADLIVLRHPEVGASEVAARYATKPVISAGDGVGEHPTQGLLDLYTIQRDLGRLDGLKIAMVGDLKNGRTVHSLTRLLSRYNVDFYFVSPTSCACPPKPWPKCRHTAAKRSRSLMSTKSSPTWMCCTVTRVQKERFSDLAAYEEVKNYYIVDTDLMDLAKEDMVVMHPLPRVGEISYAVDQDRGPLTSVRWKMACSSAWPCWRRF